MNVQRQTAWARLVLGVMAWTITVAACTPASAAAQWFRGQLHTHSYWSDGRAFPEQAIDAYKQHGYHFMCLSDHNRFADDATQWRRVEKDEGDWPGNVTQEMYDAYRAAFGGEWVESRTEDGVTAVRLKTYAEMKAQFEEPGRFLLLPGVEITQTLNGVAVHQNYVNLPRVIPGAQGPDLVKKIEGSPMSASDLMSMNAAETARLATDLKTPYLLMLNHPFWVYCDIVPQNLMDCPEIRFFEICNGGSSFSPHSQAASYTPDKFWDVVNAFRSLRGQALLYGIGSDDAHYYDPKRINRNGGVGDAWIMVRAEALTTDHLMDALRRGAFYATTGVLLDDVTFSIADKTLRIKVTAEPGAAYRIHFITTRHGFDQGLTEIASPAEGDRPARTIPIYSEDIGRTVKTVDGTEAEYQMTAEDWYVRACVESDRPSKFTEHFHPIVQTAWTQPYAPE